MLPRWDERNAADCRMQESKLYSPRWVAQSVRRCGDKFKRGIHTFQVFAHFSHTILDFLIAGVILV
jgi:hypothetical protein